MINKTGYSSFFNPLGFIPIFFLFFIVFSCEEKPALDIKELTIITKNPSRLADWYAKNLGFLPSKEGDLLHHPNLTIILDEESKAISEDSLKKAYNLDLVPGFFKFGFCTNQIHELEKVLRENDVEFVGSLVYDDKLERRTFIVKDPDGNRIQFFEDQGNSKLKPYFISLIVESIGESEKWYQVKMPIEETYNLDLPEREIYIRLLEGAGIAIELIQGADRPVKSEIDYSHVSGFYHVEVEGALGAFDQDSEGNKVIQLPSEMEQKLNNQE